MKYSMCAWKRALCACFVLVLFSGELHAQSWLPTPPPIPADTTQYLVTLWQGNKVWVRRPPDTLMNPANLIIRFRPGALDSGILSQTYWEYFYGHNAKKKVSAQPLSGGGGPYDGVNQPRGFFPALRSLLFADRFWFDSSSNIVKDTLLRNFLITNHGHWLRRLTAASPLDTLTITRMGDTVPSDLPCYMVLNFDSSVNPLYLAYLLVWEFPKDIAVAYPDYHGGQLYGQPSDVYYTLGYQRGIRMIEADTAWNHEVGDTSIIVEVADAGLDWRHPDFGDTVVGNGHKWMATWDFDTNLSITYADFPDHGTAMSGIIGALSNNRIGSNSPFDTSVAGIAGGHGSLPSDTTSMGRGVTLAGYVTNPGNGFLAWISSIFESSSRSPNTPFGLGANIINCSEGWAYAPGGITHEPEDLHATLNYAYLNGVTFVAAVADADTDIVRNYPSDYDDPWVIAVGGSWNQDDREKQPASDYGYTLDLIAPSGLGGDTGGTNPYVLNFTTRKLTPTSPFTYGPYGGTSASAANVSGSAALLLSHFVRTDSALRNIEPEDIQNILKASAWRGDTERLAHPEHSHSWVPHNGYGHLDIGHAFQMLDTNRSNSPDAGYKLYHVQFIGFPALGSGGWSSFVTGFQFSPPWESENMGDTFISPVLQYLPETPYGYKVRSRVLTATDTLPKNLENSDTCSLFVWGRSGGLGRPSGWSFASEPNYETGWTKVTNGLGSDPDSLMDGIFAPLDGIVHLETVQYDVYAWNDTTGSYSKYLGHWPQDGVVATNFSYFGRNKQAANSVEEGPSQESDSLIVSVSPNGTLIDARFFTSANLSNATVEFRDVLGRLLYSDRLNYTNSGWNEIKVPSNDMASGAYFCVVTAENYFHVKNFLLLR
ncbi:MAG TPA: S8 family peptidase [Candidatus Kapabacteria bacterium]|nr:S8 family peptidase [Candidatus Kapabacteria bacterium]